MPVAVGVSLTFQKVIPHLMKYPIKFNRVRIWVYYHVLDVDGDLELVFTPKPFRPWQDSAFLAALRLQLKLLQCPDRPLH